SAGGTGPNVADHVPDPIGRIGDVVLPLRTRIVRSRWLRRQTRHCVPDVQRPDGGERLVAAEVSLRSGRVALAFGVLWKDAADAGGACPGVTLAVGGVPCGF